MQFFKELPPGLWLIKWIDRFYLGRGEAESPFVHVALQRLLFDDLPLVTRLSQDDTAYLLGKRPGPALQDPTVFRTERVLAGYLPLLRVGDIARDGSIVGRLPCVRDTITLNNSAEVKSLSVSDKLPQPESWSAGVYRLLNRFDYHLDGIPDIYKAGCLVVRKNKIDFIIPKMVIFQTFYGFHTRMVNALCGGPWGLTAKKVISFDDYESGISTGIDDGTGAWRIVLETGIRSDLAPAIALLWFDPFARAATDALYTDALSQNSGVSSGDNRSWFTNANIPHQIDSRPFRMDVMGFPLRPFIPSAPDDAPKKFLVHSIVRSSWSLPDQLILWELANSNAKGAEQTQTTERKPFGGKRPVEADPNAVATSDEDPNAGSAVNLAYGGTFEFIEKPKASKQAKTTSKSYPESSTVTTEDPDTVISSGNPVHGEGRPSKGEAEQRVRKPSKLFLHLVAALEALVRQGMVESFEAVAPPGDAGLLIVRNGIPCWSLLHLRDRMYNKTPKTGWEVIHDSHIVNGVDVPKRYARCLLIMRVILQSRSMILMEIEPRPGESSFCIYAFEQDQELVSWYVEQVISDIRAQMGRLSDSSLAKVFELLTVNPVRALKHAYEYPKGVPKEEAEPIGIRANLLGAAIERALAPKK